MRAYLCDRTVAQLYNSHYGKIVYFRHQGRLQSSFSMPQYFYYPLHRLSVYILNALLSRTRNFLNALFRRVYTVRLLYVRQYCYRRCAIVRTYHWKNCVIFLAGSDENNLAPHNHCLNELAPEFQWGERVSLISGAIIKFSRRTCKKIAIFSGMSYYGTQL